MAILKEKAGMLIKPKRSLSNGNDDWSNRFNDNVICKPGPEPCFFQKSLSNNSKIRGPPVLGDFFAKKSC
jgi:hypothetical protein